MCKLVLVFYWDWLIVRWKLCVELWDLDISLRDLLISLFDKRIIMRQSFEGEFNVRQGRVLKENHHILIG